jgi:choline dehydrogenase
MTHDSGVYDYVIVGAGSAGCVLANRLSADPQRRVCLLEAGPEDHSALIKTPIGIALLLQTKKFNWAFDTEAEAQLNDRRLYWPRGKTLGGSSAINAMIYMRGDGADYDEWAALGNTGWGWRDLLPLFKRLEHHEAGASESHGVGGPLNVAALRSSNLLSQVFVNAGREVGLPVCADFNTGVQREGVGFYEVTQKQGQRWSAADAFLAPIRHRPNLTVITGALASGIEFRQTHAQAVRFLVKGAAHVVRAAKEIVLCAGAIQSPQLLMLSGVGQRDALASQQIAVIHDLPGVGANLQDHLNITVRCRNRSKLAIGLGAGMLVRGVAELFDYLKHRRGMFTSNIAEAGGFAKTRPDLDRPDVQFHFIPGHLKNHGRTPVFGYGYSLHVCQLRPKSRGTIALRSANPSDPPRIHANYLSHVDDRDTLVKSVRLARKIFSAPAFAAHDGGEVAPGPKLHSDAQILDFVRANAETIYHPVGSCKMGNDPLAVVDARLRVHGVTGLRVADASIMPTLIGGNTNAPCMVIGEKAAEMILADAGANA